MTDRKHLPRLSWWRGWPLAIATAAFAFTAVNAMRYGPNSYSFVAMVINGFLVLAALLLLVVPVPKSQAEIAAIDAVADKLKALTDRLDAVDSAARSRTETQENP